MDEVIGKALVRKPTPVEWEESASPPPKSEGADEAAGGFRAH